MESHGFARALRLLSSREYQHVFDNACYKVHGKGVLALAFPNDLNHARVGMVFSKKTMRRAVDRNRLKRLTRESIRLRQHWLPAVDIVVLSKRGVADLDNETLKRQFHGMWRRLEQDVKRNRSKKSA
ncbi:MULTISPECIES: ribonuclease P protein component [Larsenimonas]|uniref:Ribonuclease P protein component n=1 Tax=Larsenimonas suaedae TaxID=1851019 RepID=A0ABU1GR69_9GAMM|nr:MULTISPECIES: ribonuclease P protein component [Larsenimonas]MCM2972693.1 ribonuclease P protein component [Larsenimonas suaedae]MCM5704670.1 ribonuclease P protein component [Larsenimonas salina]MDR5894510.1 ribonuclease P protein component [Larsenimonas suaedae]